MILLYTITHKFQWISLSMLVILNWGMTVFEGRPIGLLIELNYDFDVVVTTWNS